MLCSVIGVDGLDSPLPLLGSRKLLARFCSWDAESNQKTFMKNKIKYLLISYKTLNIQCSVKMLWVTQPTIIYRKEHNEKRHKAIWAGHQEPASALDFFIELGPVVIKNHSWSKCCAILFISKFFAGHFWSLCQTHFQLNREYYPHNTDCERKSVRA